MSYVKFHAPIIIKYEPSDLERYLEQQLNKHGFAFSEPVFKISDEFGVLSRITTKPNRKNHYFYYRLSYMYDYYDMFDFNENIKVENLMRDLSMIGNPATQGELETSETFGFTEKNSKKEDPDVVSFRFQMEEFGYRLKPDCGVLIPANSNNELLTKKIDIYTFKELTPLLDEVVRIFTNSLYK